LGNMKNKLYRTAGLSNGSVEDILNEMANENYILDQTFNIGEHVCGVFKHSPILYLMAPEDS